MLYRHLRHITNLINHLRLTYNDLCLLRNLLNYYRTCWLKIASLLNYLRTYCLNITSSWLLHSANSTNSTYSNSSFNSLTRSHWSIPTSFISFFLSLILNFFFHSLLRHKISFSLISNFRVIFNLMLNYLVFCNVFVIWNSNFSF